MNTKKDLTGLKNYLESKGYNVVGATDEELILMYKDDEKNKIESKIKREKNGI